ARLEGRDHSVVVTLPAIRRHEIHEQVNALGVRRDNPGFLCQRPTRLAVLLRSSSPDGPVNALVRQQNRRRPRQGHGHSTALQARPSKYFTATSPTPRRCPPSSAPRCPA